MSTSITASNSAAPFNQVLLTDSNYITSVAFSASVTASSPSINFGDPIPYPALNNSLAYVTSYNMTTGSGSVSVILQGSPDNSTWTALSNIANPLITATGSVVSASTTVTLQQTQPQFLRVVAVPQAGTGVPPTGSVTLTLLF
jgi:hypothetical protein